jgi:hypothetical protein
MRDRVVFKTLLCLAVLLGFPALAAELGSVRGISEDVDELELYQKPDDEDPAAMLARGALGGPTPILAVSENGMYRIQVNGKDYWVISDDVVADRTRAVDTACEPKMAGKVIAHGKRGAGKDCK